MRKILMTAAAALAASSMTIPASAQIAGPGLITVQITNVDILRNSLNKNDVDILNNLLNNNQIAVPVSVQVPVGIAANVCNTTVAILSAAASGGTCTAQQASGALGQAISKQLLRQR
jgi:hypothetical protein